MDKTMSKQFEIYSATKPFGTQWAVGYFKQKSDASGWYHIEKFDAGDIAKSMGIDDIDVLLETLNSHWKK